MRPFICYGIIFILSMLKGFSSVCIARASSQFEVANGESLEFHNFDVDDSLKVGLETIFSGRAFRPSGVPFKIKKRVDRLINMMPGGLVKSFPVNHRGILPSPTSRRQGFSPEGMDYGLNRSIFETGLCHTPKGEPITVTLPPDEYALDLDCQNVSERTLIIEHNCFTCHTGIAGNHVIAGAHSNYTNQKYLHEEITSLFKLFEPSIVDHGEYKQPSSFRNWLLNKLFSLTLYDRQILFDYFNFSSRAMLETFIHANTLGDNIGLYTSYGGIAALAGNGEPFALLSYKDKTASGKSLFHGIENLPTVDANPWWHLKFKKHVFWKGEEAIGNPQRDIIRFLHGFNFQSVGMHLDHDRSTKRLADVFEYAKGIDSPKYPWSINNEKAKRGRDLFHSKPVFYNGETVHCSSCHGVYDPSSDDLTSYKVTYPGTLTEILDVDTDANYSSITYEISKRLQPIIETSVLATANKFGKDFAETYSPMVEVGVRTGVVPPPLVGIWASPPYFHNGSVPTIYMVLKPKSRPSEWLRPSISKDGYDRIRLGFLIEEDSKSSTPSIEMYRTSEFGKSNSGHTFAEDWSDNDVYAVIEFLKTLSGPKIKPASTEQGLDVDIFAVKHLPNQTR